MTNTATQQQAINALEPGAQEDAKALVPVDNEQEAKPVADLAKSPGLTTFLNQIADFAGAQANSPAQWERRRQAVKLRKMVLGEYYGIFDKTRGWVSGRDEGDGIYYDPSVATFIDTLVAQLVKAKPRKALHGPSLRMSTSGKRRVLRKNSYASTTTRTLRQSASSGNGRPTCSVPARPTG
jgi:hypothetical protein